MNKCRVKDCEKETAENKSFCGIHTSPDVLFELAKKDKRLERGPQIWAEGLIYGLCKQFEEEELKMEKLK